jgi:hypothetical protein
MPPERANWKLAMMAPPMMIATPASSKSRAN